MKNMAEPTQTDQEGASTKPDNRDKIYYDNYGVSLAFDLGGRTLRFRLVDLVSFDRDSFELTSISSGTKYGGLDKSYLNSVYNFYELMLIDLTDVLESMDLLGHVKSLYSMSSFPLSYHPYGCHSPTIASAYRALRIHGITLDKLAEGSGIQDLHACKSDADKPETSSRHLEFLILTHVFDENTSGCYIDKLPQVTKEAPQEQEEKFAEIGNLVINGIRKLIDKYVKEYDPKTLSQFTIDNLYINGSQSGLSIPSLCCYCLDSSKSVNAYRLKMLLEGLRPEQIGVNIQNALRSINNEFDKESKRIIAEYNNQHSEEFKSIYQAQQKLAGQFDEHKTRLQTLLTDAFAKHKQLYQEAFKDFIGFMESRAAK